MCKNTTTTLFIVFGMAMTALAVLSIHYEGMVGVACVGSFLSIGIIIAYMSRSFTCRRSSSSDAERQQASEDEEDQDSPPSYDVVTAKPPPYYLLYDTNSPSTDGVTADGIPDAVIYHTPIGLGPLDQDHKKNVWQRNTWSLLAQPETSPPSFSQAIRSSLGWTTPETRATAPCSSPQWEHTFSSIPQ
ncbi:uncharacterized protein [Panulirus ornatus]|uniref:uncharacterized protein n=1 Tax=Panulirus ornatus TaxID=150431 RepID=UPI003A84DB7C